MMNSTYKVLTPAGQFDAIFAEDEDITIEYSGDELAISFFKDWLFFNQISGEHGLLLDSQNLTPRELYGFCQPPESGIEVMPPFEDLLAYIQEDATNPVENNDNQPRDEFDSATSNGEVENMKDVALDGLSGIEKIRLIKEAGSIRSNLQTVQSGMEKLKMVKRIKEIRDALGVDGSATEPEVKPQATTEDVGKIMPLLKKFIGAAQLSAIGSDLSGEEGQSFKDRLIEIAEVIKTMPKSYDTDGQGDKAIAYLHYFKSSGDWYITEKDTEDEQLRAFGLANLGYGGELGYISIQELIDSGVELDLYWKPKTIGAVKGTDNQVATENEEQGSSSSLVVNAGLILDELVSKYGWSDKKFELSNDDHNTIFLAMARKDVGGGSAGYMVNREGARNVYARFDSTGKNLSMQRGDNNEFTIDVENRDMADVAKEFNGKTTEWAIRTAEDKGTLKVGSENNSSVEQQENKLTDPVKDVFILELESLKTETDINRFNERLDEVAARIEQAGMMEALDAELNQTADVLTSLL